MSGATERDPGVATVLLRGLRKKCPRCGSGGLYRRWQELHERCLVCGLGFAERSGDTWFVMYMTTAGLTGVLIVAMLLIHPANLWLGRFVLFAAAVLLILGTAPYRKGLALALDYLVTRTFDARERSD